MGHRIFIAINLPEEIKNQLAGHQDRWLELPCRWTKKDNLHVTLEFLGYLADEGLIELCQKTRESVSEKKSFNLYLNKICYGPPSRGRSPALASPELQRSAGRRGEGPQGEKSPRSMSPSDSFLRSLSFSTKNKTPRMVWVIGEKIKEFNITPHITLGRIKTWQFKQIDPEEMPEINEEINLSFEVKSIEIMESRLKRGGAEYNILESIPLKTNNLK